MRVDAHQHFWRINRGDYGWLTAERERLYRDYTPEDLAPLLARYEIEETVLVQAAPTLKETLYLLQLAHQTPFVVGEPTRSMFALTLSGTPCNGPPRSPFAIARSTLSAPASASLANTTGIALIFGFTSAIRSRWASTTARELTWRFAMSVASSPADLRHSTSLTSISAEWAAA